ncbi:hypothetical protein TTHERM_00338100 (macronuclear) [Tetrahymena thermophila SB210]|uniref:Uncharacterized protein n=1 Tax=Tetrahymena thermophila (strain SB210) TaxID=312017 RepID=I7MEP8_TETTS|nr:hypothetical protein TTHERM_00338100 [Tetrahymena thermophila SB210]EAR97331.1 hypothetical protein TTHERM_00338100 [Tetrahymena thermophila SB210]|eukprot:XP_001017576.1 hypothetical protein TTHERM_00338100 [Tetrahymena thermophila SB210]
MQVQDQQLKIENLAHAQQEQNSKQVQFNQQNWNPHQSSDIETANTTLKSNNLNNGQNSPGGMQLESSTSQVIPQDLTQQKNDSIEIEQNSSKGIQISVRDSKNEQYSPNRSILLLKQSSILSSSQQANSGKQVLQGEGMETNSPTRSIRSSKSNRSSILTIKQTNSNRSSMEQELKTGNSLYEKKRARYCYIKNWEDKRIQVTSIFNNIYCNISENLVKIASQSHQFIDTFLTFLKETQIQMAQFAKSPLTQLGQAYSYSPQINNVSYSSINKIFKQISSLESTVGLNSQQLSAYIDQSIIRPYLLSDKKNFTQKFEAFQTTLKEKQSRIHKLAKIAVSTYDEFTNSFKEMNQLQLKGKDSKKDFYYQELLYMHHANEHFENLREFGLYVFRFVEELEQLQLNRINNINQALTLYVQKRSQMIDGIENSNYILQMLNQVQSEMQKNVINIEQLLQPEQANYIKKCYSKDEIDMQILKQFAMDFQLKTPGEKNLVIKEFTAQQIEKENNPKKEWRDCSIILTVDNYLIISPGLLDSFSKPNSTIYLPLSKAIFNKEQMIVTIVETTKKLFWKSKKSYNFKIQHEFDANEITSFLQDNSHVFNQKSKEAINSPPEIITLSNNQQK